MDARRPSRHLGRTTKYELWNLRSKTYLLSYETNRQLASTSSNLSKCFSTGVQKLHFLKRYMVSKCWIIQWSVFLTPQCNQPSLQHKKVSRWSAQSIYFYAGRSHLSRERSLQHFWFDRWTGRGDWVVCSCVWVNSISYFEAEFCTESIERTFLCEDKRWYIYL